MPSLLSPQIPIPSAQIQLQFLTDIQQLLQLAETTSTYKYALLLSITRLAIEQGEASGNALTLKIEDIAEKFIELYWNQARPFHFNNEHALILNQNSGSAQAKVISLIIEAQKNAPTITQARMQSTAWHQLKKSVSQVIRNNPLERLQIINRVPIEFLYRYADCSSSELSLLPNVMHCLRSFNVIIEELCQKAWTDNVRLNKHNNHLLDNLPDLDTFLFESNRNQLQKAYPILQEIQDNRCFYCGKTITKAKGAVDHFIPWSLYQYDTAHNFVLTDQTCNSQKSNMLAAPQFYEKWLSRNIQYDAVITQKIGSIGFIADKHRSESIAAWAYHLFDSQNSPINFWNPLQAAPRVTDSNTSSTINPLVSSRHQISTP